MKKFSLFTALFFFVIPFSFSQITITGNDFPVIGDTTFSVQDTAPTVSISVGLPGANQTWDLIGIADEMRDSSLFVDPSTLPEANDFPFANIGIVDLPGNTRIYSDFNISQIDILGFAGDLFETGSDITLYNDPAAIFAPLPLNYGDNWDDAYQRFAVFENPGFFPSNFDSLAILSNIESFDTIDGWGTLVTPMGAYDALRQVNYTYNQDSIFAKDQVLGWIFITAEMDSSKTYRWWTPGIGPTAEVEMDSTFSGIEMAGYELAPPMVGVEEPFAAIGSLNVYPNPATDRTRIDYRLQASGEVEITLENVLGQTLEVLLPATNQQVGEYSLKPNLSRIAAGNSMVMVKLRVEDTVIVKKLVLEE